MNIYEKLSVARIMFQNSGIRMTGKNDYAGYSYFELSDILPIINKISNELKFLCEVSFTDSSAELKVRDIEKPEDVIVFTSPMSKASLKGCHEVQNLGAVETYIKRYLYQNAFEIVESDVLNKTQGISEKQQVIKPVNKPLVNKQDVNKQAKLTEEELKEYIELKGALIDFINAGAFRYPANVDKVINDKNLPAMRKALDQAKGGNHD